jgi:glycyl-tRNA synthetase beta chain
MAYAIEQGVPRDVAGVIAEHYLPRGADDPTASSDAGALAAIADRIDTLVGCFSVGLVPTGAADPLALRRAAIGLLRTVLDRQWDLPLDAAIQSAFLGFEGTRLDLDLDDTKAKLLDFLKQRLRGVLDGPQDVIDACLSVSGERPYDVALRAGALAALDEETRAGVGEVFKRAANIAKDAPEGPASDPSEFDGEVHESEQAVFDGLSSLRRSLESFSDAGDYHAALNAIAAFAPTLGQFFEDVFVMVDDLDLRNNRLRLMCEIHETCSSLANFNQLAGRKVYEP